MSKTTKTPAKTPRAPRATKGQKTEAQAPAAQAPEAQAPAGIKFRIAEGMRPTAGARLFAHTAVFMQASGMADGRAVPGAHVREILGSRAIAWHQGKGNIEDTPEGLKLTEAGKMAFAARKVSAELRAAFEAVLLRGETNDAAGVKNPAIIHPVKGMDVKPGDKQ